MQRGLLLSSDIKSQRWPWTPTFSEHETAAPALSDPVWQFVPWLLLARRELAAGWLPLWNPHQDGGVPLLGNGQSALASPLNWPVLLLGADPGWNLSLLFRILLAAVGAFLFLRDLGRSRLAAALGSAAFSLSGAFVAWLEHPLVLAAAPAPLVLLFARRTALAASPRTIAGLAVSTALVLTGGHPETALMVALLASSAVAFAGSGRRRWRPAAAGGALGLGLAAPVLFPFAEYFALSQARLGIGRHPFVLPPRDLLRFFQPRLSGSNVIEAAATVSIPVLLLLPLGAWAGRRQRETRFWALAAAAILLVVYSNPLSRALALATPVYWTRLLLLLPLAVGVLGAAGLDTLKTALERRSRFVATAACAGVVAVSLAQLLDAARGVHAVTPAAWRAPQTPLLAKLEADREPYRILPFHTFLSPDSATDYGLDDVRGYDALDPAGWRRQRERVGKFRDTPTQKDVLEPWDLEPGGAALDEWNVKYLLQPPQYSFGAETLNARKGLDVETIYEGPDGRIFQNRRVKPRIRFDGEGEATLLERRPAFWRIEVLARSPGVLRVRNPFFPGWRARLDGSPADVGAAAPGEPFAVAVPAGRHRVELAYRPFSFAAGSAVGFASAVAVGWLALGKPRRGEALRQSPGAFGRWG